MSVTAQAVENIIKEEPTKTLGPRKEKSHLKIFWDHCYNNCSGTEFKEHMRGDRGTFELMLNRIRALIRSLNSSFSLTFE